jgi:hypothetical protein
MRKYPSGFGCFGMGGKISEPFKSSGSGARRWAYSKMPRFSGLVALLVPTCPGLTCNVVEPNRRREASSASVEALAGDSMEKVAAHTIWGLVRCQQRIALLGELAIGRHGEGTTGCRE